MKHKNHLLITLISTLTLLMVTPNYALGQKNYCKGSCDDKKFFGKIGCWIAKSWKQGYKKREDACFGRYDPANFGNAIALYLPLKYKHFDFLFDLHNYTNKTESGFGIGAGLFNFKLSEKIESDITLNLWNQPKTFFDNTKIFGGQLNIAARYNFTNNFNGFIGVCGKTKGWTMANPYLQENITLQIGLNYNLRK